MYHIFAIGISWFHDILKPVLFAGRLTLHRATITRVQIAFSGRKARNVGGAIPFIAGHFVLKAGATLTEKAACPLLHWPVAVSEDGGQVDTEPSRYSRGCCVVTLNITKPQNEQQQPRGVVHIHILKG